MEVACWKQLAQCVESTTCQSQTGLPTELPNYNLPPTYACMDSIYDYTTKLSSSNPPVEKNGQNCGILAHSPEPPPKVDRSSKPLDNNSIVLSPTKVTNNHTDHSFRPYKPVPPPKPKIMSKSGRPRNYISKFPNSEDSYYLNLPSRDQLVRVFLKNRSSRIQIFMKISIFT